MDAFADALIDALGGTGEVSNLAASPASTVSSWRRTGLSPSRLNHLQRIARDATPIIDVALLAKNHGVILSELIDCERVSHESIVTLTGARHHV